MVVQRPNPDQTEMDVQNILIAMEAGMIDFETAAKLLADLDPAPTES
jgi:hypothetical protein